MPFAPAALDQTVLKLTSTSLIFQLPSSVKQHASCSKASEHARWDPYAGLFLMLDSQLHYLRMQWMLQGEADPLNHHPPPSGFLDLSKELQNLDLGFEVPWSDWLFEQSIEVEAVARF